MTEADGEVAKAADILQELQVIVASDLKYNLLTLGGDIWINGTRGEGPFYN